MILSQLQALAHTSQREAFLKQSPPAFLHFRAADHASNGEWQFKTRTVMVTGVGRPTAAPVAVEHGGPIFLLQKAGNNPWPDRITIGRAKNNDVVLADASVSKLHAYISYGTGSDIGSGSGIGSRTGSRSGNSVGSSIALTDAGSRNGSRINEVKVLPGQPMPINFGDLLLLGALLFVILNPPSTYDVLRQTI